MIVHSFMFSHFFRIFNCSRFSNQIAIAEFSVEHFRGPKVLSMQQRSGFSLRSGWNLMKTPHVTGWKIPPFEWMSRCMDPIENWGIFPACHSLVFRGVKLKSERFWFSAESTVSPKRLHQGCHYVILCAHIVLQMMWCKKREHQTGIKFFRAMMWCP